MERILAGAEASLEPECADAKLLHNMSQIGKDNIEMNEYDNDNIDMTVEKLWKALTEMRNNSHSHKVINALIDAFGNECVYDESPWTFDKPELERIYKVLNETAFDNELRPNLPIYYETLSNIDKIIK